MQLWGLASLKSVGLASKLRTQGRVDAVGFTSVGQADRLETQKGVDVVVWSLNSFHSWKPQFLLLGPSTD